MCSYFDPIPTRELLIYSADERKHRDMCAFLTQGTGCESFLYNENENDNTTIDGIFMTAYTQGNVKASRKQVAPFLLSYFENM